MEFYEKLQQLRKSHNLTQEQLAAELFVSRTAVSKWESGRGFPNLETLKSISKRFDVSIDWLLSNEQLFDIAAKENRDNLKQVSDMVWGMLDAIALILLFVPLFGQREGDFFRGVPLFQLVNANKILYIFYVLALCFLSLIGITELFLIKKCCTKWQERLCVISLAIHSLAILLFAISNQPYPTAFLFLFFVMKSGVKIRNNASKC